MAPWQLVLVYLAIFAVTLGGMVSLSWLFCYELPMRRHRRERAARIGPLLDYYESVVNELSRARREGEG